MSGERGPGGNGTGEDLSMYHMEHWEITPGVGGKEMWESDPSCQLGGGGGGVLVNGVGPDRIDDGQGEGYGGGGNHAVRNNKEVGGLRGVVLIEVSKTIETTKAPKGSITHREILKVAS